MKFTEFNLDHDLKLSEFKNRKISLCNSKTDGPVRIQIPRMYMPFGLSSFTPEVGPTKWNIDFSMKGHDEDGNYVKKFYDFLKNLEGVIINHVIENSDVIFKRTISKYELESIFNSNIKESAGREPKFRVKFDPATVPVFDVNNQKVTEDFKTGAFSRQSGASMIELHSVYFMNKMFGITWKMYQMKVYEPQRLKGFHFDEAEAEAEAGATISGFQFQV